MSGFAHDVAGGSGNLIVTALQSPNFVTKVAGWQIAKDGSAQFNNVTIRGGEVIGGTTLIYDGTPGPGTLFASVSGAAGVDQYGNDYYAGVYLYGPGGSYAALETVGGLPATAYVPASVVYATNAPCVVSTSQNAGAANETMYLVASSGKESGNDDAALQLFSESADATAAARAVLEFGGTIAATITKTGLTSDVPITATAGTKTNATVITTDTFTAGSGAGDWIGSGDGVNGFAFTLGPDGWVDVAIDVKTNAADAGTTLCDIPSGYAPGTSVAGAGFIGDVAASGAFYFVSANSGGTLAAPELPATVASGTRFVGMARYRTAAY